MKGWTEGYVIGMLPTHDITVTPAEGGSIGVNKTVAAPGMSVSLILEADDDYELVGFEIKDADGAAVAYTGTDGEYTFSMPDKDVTVSASFKLIHEHDWAYVQQGENTIACVCNNNDGKCPNGNDGGKVILTAESKTYDGAAAEVKVENSLITGETVEPIMTDLAANTTLTGTPADAGIYRASVTVGGVTASVDFTISQRSIADAALTVTSSHVYNGEAHTPAVILTVDGVTLTPADYDLECANNIAAGTASVTATGKGNYTDSVSATFTIAKAAGETSVSIAGWTYGEAANAPIPVSATNGTDAVTYIYTGTDNSGTAYGPSAEAPVDAGGYTVTATFAANANYAEATAKADFIVAKAQMAAPIGLTAVYGNVLSSVTLPAGFTWVEPTAPVGEAGENGHLANFVGDANYEAAQNMVVQVTVNQSQTEMTAAADKTDYTYGEKISVTVTTAATGSASPFSLRRLAAPAAGQVALYNGSEQITEPFSAGTADTVIYTLDTVEDGFVLGSYTLTAKYTASDNMDAQEVNFTFNVAFAEDTPENDAALSGNCNEEGWYGEDPTLIAPEGGQISLDYGPEATWSNHLTLPTEEGEHTYTYYVKDENGLISEKTVTVMVDKSAPEVVDILVEVSTNGAEIIVTATDELSGVQGMNLEQGSGKEKLTVTDNGEGGFTVSGMEPGKSYDLTLTVRDKVGHQTTVTITVTAAQLPQTGDSSNLILWMMMLGLASCELLCLRRRVN